MQRLERLLAISFLALLFFAPVPSQAQSPCQWQYTLINNQAQAGYCGNAVINGTLSVSGVPVGGTVNPGTAGDGAYYAATGSAVSDAGSAVVTFGSLNVTSTPGASQSAATFSGIPFTGGTGITTFPLFYMNTTGATAPTSFNTGGAFIGINGPSGFGGNFLDFHVNGSGTLFAVTSSGAVVANGNLNSGAGASIFWSGRSVMTSPADGQFKITNHAGSTTLFDYGVTHAGFTPNGPIIRKGYTVSTLPASPGQGASAFVTDATVCSFLGALTGGGSTFCPTIYNGTTWVAD